MVRWLHLRNSSPRTTNPSRDSESKQNSDDVGHPPQCWARQWRRQSKKWYLRTETIQISDLEVRYGDHQAVDKLNLTIESGLIYGLLGPNGAGKSTTIHCLCGIMEPNAGRIEIHGQSVSENPKAVRSRVGFVPQTLALYEQLSVHHNLEIFGGLFGLNSSALTKRIEWALEIAQLQNRSSDRVQTLSGGMKRRLNLVSSLLHDPSVIVCDEPTTGVDPQSRNHLFDSIRALNKEGRTVIYTTHYMEEVEALCDRVAIMDHGRIIAEDSLQSFLSENTSLEQVFLDRTGRGLRDEA